MKIKISIQNKNNLLLIGQQLAISLDFERSLAGL